MVCGADGTCDTNAFTENFGVSASVVVRARRALGPAPSRRGPRLTRGGPRTRQISANSYDTVNAPECAELIYTPVPAWPRKEAANLTSGGAPVSQGGCNPFAWFSSSTVTCVGRRTERARNSTRRRRKTD